MPPFFTTKVDVPLRKRDLESVLIERQLGLFGELPADAPVVHVLDPRSDDEIDAVVRQFADRDDRSGVGQDPRIAGHQLLQELPDRPQVILVTAAHHQVGPAVVVAARVQDGVAVVDEPRAVVVLHPTGAAAVSDIIKDKPIINVPGCPPIPV